MSEEKILYCIENQEEGTNYGKHQFVFEEGFGFTCKFCFLPKNKANYKPMTKRIDGKFHFVEIDAQ